jgi:hypothetical protein
VALEVLQQRDRADVLLAAGTDDAHQRLLNLGAVRCAVAAPVLAVDDGGVDRLFGAPVGCCDAGCGQEGEQVLAFAG